LKEGKRNSSSRLALRCGPQEVETGTIVNNQKFRVTAALVLHSHDSKIQISLAKAKVNIKLQQPRRIERYQLTAGI
jgi:hypothetical protein